MIIMTSYGTILGIEITDPLTGAIFSCILGLILILISIYSFLKGIEYYKIYKGDFRSQYDNEGDKLILKQVFYPRIYWAYEVMKEDSQYKNLFNSGFFWSIFFQVGWVTFILGIVFTSVGIHFVSSRYAILSIVFFIILLIALAALYADKFEKCLNQGKIDRSKNSWRLRCKLSFREKSDL